MLDADYFLPIFNYDKYITRQGEREHSSAPVLSSRQISARDSPDYPIELALLNCSKSLIGCAGEGADLNSFHQ